MYKQVICSSCYGRDGGRNSARRPRCEVCRRAETKDFGLREIGGLLDGRRASKNASSKRLACPDCLRGILSSPSSVKRETERVARFLSSTLGVPCPVPSISELRPGQGSLSSGGGKGGEAERDRQRQTETDRDRQRQTQTDRDREDVTIQHLINPRLRLG